MLSADDIHGDRADDLAVADPSYGCRDEPDVDYGREVVILLPCSAQGLTVTEAQIWTQDSAGGEGTSRLGNVFGESLAIGHLDRHAIDDLAIGAPGDLDGGSVTLLLGSSVGLSTRGTGGVTDHEVTAGIVRTPEPGDSFGDTVSTGNLRSKTQSSLILGTPGEDVAAVPPCGTRNLMGSVRDPTEPGSDCAAVISVSKYNVVTSWSVSTRPGARFVGGSCNLLGHDRCVQAARQAGLKGRLDSRPVCGRCAAARS